MIALISDIHGNYSALSEVLKDIKLLGIEEIYCLGDISGYYPQINECCNELRRLGVKSILGNHDWYMISNSKCPRSKSANDCLLYQRSVITKDNLDWLTELPLCRSINELFLVHGGWNNPLDEYVNPSKEYFADFPNKYFASGHTHIQVIQKLGNKIYCNPGSVGQPRDGDPKAAYAVFDGVDFHLRRVAYNIDDACNAMKQAGFDSYYYNRLRLGSAHFVK